MCVCIYVGIYYPFLYVKLYNTFKTSQITFNLIAQTKSQIPQVFLSVSVDIYICNLFIFLFFYSYTSYRVILELIHLFQCIISLFQNLPNYSL